MNQAKTEANLKAGAVFMLTNHVYTQLMIVSDKKIDVPGGVMRECVAWNADRCRRYDMTEQELKSFAPVTQLDDDFVAEYVSQNKQNEWENPKAPL